MSGEVTITPRDPAGRGLTLIRTGEDTLVGGVGGWESLDRPRRSTAAGWVGGTPLTLEIPLLLDGMEFTPGRNVSVEPQCRQVAAFGLPTDKTGRPPILQVSGSTMSSKSARWVLQEIEWGERVRNASGRRIQQALVLTLLRYVEPKLLSSPAKKSRNRRAPAGERAPW